MSRIMVLRRRIKTGGPYFARSGAIDMHLDISQEPLYSKLYRKNAGAD